MNKNTAAEQRLDEFKTLLDKTLQEHSYYVAAAQNPPYGKEYHKAKDQYEEYKNNLLAKISELLKGTK